jgi:Tfp pilus assembly protein PilW
MRKENGFTLVEAVVATFIAILMLMAIYTAVNTGQNSSSLIERKVAAQQDVRSALELMAMEVQMASYNPASSPSIWVAPALCSGSSLNSTYRGFQEPGQNSITIEMDTNDNGVIDNTTNNPNEIIKYVYDPINLSITRSTNCGPAQIFLGAPAANADSQTVLVVNNTAGPNSTSIPIFRYYNGSNTDISSSVAAYSGDIHTGIPAIRRVEITLVVDTSSADKNGSRRRIIYSTSVVPRNHTVQVRPF